METPRRIAILFSELSGYMAACLRALSRQAELLVYRWPAADDAPFAEDALYADLGHVRTKRPGEAALIYDDVRHFAPDGLLIPGWIDRDYLQVARRLRAEGVPVIAGCDTPWTGSARQRAGALVAPWHLHRAIDALWVAGERQRAFAERLGYRGDRCLNGFYACDWDRFAEAYLEHGHRAENTFLFVGRYDAVKGLDILLDAYARYREAVHDPWPLVCAGTGPLKPLLAGRPGVVDRGFVQPRDLPAHMASAAAFILPSRSEPWGVVVQEAAAAGLPLLCSTACGATTSLLQDGYNGFLTAPDDPAHLARAMARVAALGAGARREMGARSHALSKQFTPDRWADTLLAGLGAIRHRSIDALLPV